MAIKIYIDQGHNPTGYPNTGASWYGQQEQDITYAVGRYLAGMLREDGRFDVRLSRPTEDTVLGTSNATSLRRRVQEANDWGTNYFISIHANAAENTAANGTEVYVYRLYTQADWLAQHVLQGIVDTVGTKDNGVRERTNLYVLRRTAMPAILLELGFITNARDARLMNESPELFARGIYQGIVDYTGLA